MDCVLVRFTPPKVCHNYKLKIYELLEGIKMSLSSLRGLQKVHGNVESEDKFISGHKTWKVHRCTAPTNFLRTLHLNASPAVTVLGLWTPKNSRRNGAS